MWFHVRPEQGMVAGALAPIGFDVDITASFDARVQAPAPLRRTLERVARAALPTGEHASWYDVSVADGELGYDPSRRESTLSAMIAVLHRGVVNRAPDECERACVDEIRTKLLQLGLRER